MSTVAVTGAAGYIGGQIALMLGDAGHEVLGIDREPLPDHLVEVYDKFLLQDFASDDALHWLSYYNPSAVIHCAGTSLVAPSISYPNHYYDNNFVKTKLLLDHIVKTLPQTRFIFSSSAAVYGNPFMNPIHEVDPREPISAYGESKFMVELMMERYHQAYGLDYVSFRYFNACGADTLQRHGQKPGATHIIARALECLRDQQEFTLYGTKYSTDDGTCVRDYVHVSDIAMAHVLALSNKVLSGVYNLGSNTGTSNNEIIQAVERITGQRLAVNLGDNRPGDPAMLTASDDKFRQLCPHWRIHSLDDMIETAWKWYTK